MPIRIDSFTVSSASLSALALAAVLGAGCVRDPNYCPDVEPTHNCLDKGVDPRSCTTSADCSAPEAACDVDGTMTCVQCTAADDRACTGATPVCGVHHECRACVAHAECASRACLPDGSCGDDISVAYVDPAGSDNPSCTSAEPCMRVFRALATGRPYVYLVGTIDEMVTVAGGQSVTFLGGPGAKLTARVSGSGPILTVRDNGTSLTIYDLSISDAPNTLSGAGISILANGSPDVTLVRSRLINNPRGGILAAGAGILTVAQSVISGNTGGGISVTNGTFTVVGNVFYDNGTPTAAFGGLFVNTTMGGSRIELNSFHKNAVKDNFGSAIHCSGPIAARNNIMSYNGTSSNLDQIGGNCTHTYSIMRPGTLLSGPGNSSADPLFVSPETGDLHIRQGSPALRAADPSTNLTDLAARDLDGDLRTSPADIGADEVL